VYHIFLRKYTAKHFENADIITDSTFICLLWAFINVTFISVTISLYYHSTKQTEKARSPVKRKSSQSPVDHLINFPRVIYIRISHRPSSNNAHKMVFGFCSLPSRLPAPLPAYAVASPSSIYVSASVPFLFVAGEMIDRTENRSRRDSWERCIVLVCLVGARTPVFAQTRRLDVALCYRRSRSLYMKLRFFSLSLSLSSAPSSRCFSEKRAKRFLSRRVPLVSR